MIKGLNLYFTFLIQVGAGDTTKENVQWLHLPDVNLLCPLNSKTMLLMQALLLVTLATIYLLRVPTPYEERHHPDFVQLHPGQCHCLRIVRSPCDLLKGHRLDREKRK